MALRRMAIRYLHALRDGVGRDGVVVLPRAERDRRHLLRLKETRSETDFRRSAERGQHIYIYRVYRLYRG